VYDIFLFLVGSECSRGNGEREALVLHGVVDLAGIWGRKLFLSFAVCVTAQGRFLEYQWALPRMAQLAGLFMVVMAFCWWGNLEMGFGDLPVVGWADQTEVACHFVVWEGGFDFQVYVSWRIDRLDFYCQVCAVFFQGIGESEGDVADLRNRIGEFQLGEFCSG
jgi:hypothetical protein